MYTYRLQSEIKTKGTREEAETFDPVWRMVDSLSGTVYVFNVIFIFPHTMISGRSFVWMV